MMRVILLLGLVCTVYSSAIDFDVLTIDSSHDEEPKKEGKFIFAATITESVTSFTSSVTSISVTQRFCFTTTTGAANIPCQQNILMPGRKRRSDDSVIDDLPLGMGIVIDGEDVDFKTFVAQRLADIRPTQREAKKHTVQKLEFRRMELLGGPDDCFNPQSYGRMEGRSDPRFVTFRTTVTVQTISTISQTQSGANIQSIVLTDAWGGVVQAPASNAAGANVVANGGCWPISLLSTSLSITACG